MAKNKKNDYFYDAADGALTYMGVPYAGRKIIKAMRKEQQATQQYYKKGIKAERAREAAKTADARFRFVYGVDRTRTDPNDPPRPPYRTGKYSKAYKRKGSTFTRPGALPGSGPLGGQFPGAQTSALSLSSISRPLMKLTNGMQSKIMNFRYTLNNILYTSEFQYLKYGLQPTLQQHSFSVPLMPTQSINGKTRNVIAIKSIFFKYIDSFTPIMDLSVGSTTEGEILREYHTRATDHIRDGKDIIDSSQEKIRNTMNSVRLWPDTINGIAMNPVTETTPAERLWVNQTLWDSTNQSYFINSPYNTEGSCTTQTDPNVLAVSNPNWGAWTAYNRNGAGGYVTTSAYSQWAQTLKQLSTQLMTCSEKHIKFDNPIVYPGYSLRFSILSQTQKPWMHAVVTPFLIPTGVDIGALISPKIEVRIEYEERAMSQGEYIKLCNAYPNCLFQGSDVNATRDY